MQKKQAKGVDTRAMLPIYGCLFGILCELFFPWISIPALKFSKFPSAYSFWKMDACIRNVQKSIGQGGKMKMPPFSGEELQMLQNIGIGMKTAAVLLAVLLLVCGILVYIKRKKSILLVKISFAVTALFSLTAFLMVGAGNLFMNDRMGRESNFINLTIHSYLQLTAWIYAQLIVSVILFILAGKLLDTEAEYEPQKYIDRTEKTDRRVSTRTKVSVLLILIAIPAVIFFGIFFLNDRSNSFIALCIIGLAMIPFGMVFEDRKPQAREILLIAVMAAIAVVGRVAFFMIPQFKPVSAIVIIAGVGLGAEAGFLTGAISGFVSNFFFGQGPWTPWQMFAFGIIGFLAGLLFHKSKKRKNGRRGEQIHKILLCTYGGIATLVIYGFLMDTASVSIYSKDFSWKVFLSYYVTGFPFNVIHGVSTVVFLFFMAIPMERKLDRIKKKYGILDV